MHSAAAAASEVSFTRKKGREKMVEDDGRPSRIFTRPDYITSKRIISFYFYGKCCFFEMKKKTFELLLEWPRNSSGKRMSNIPYYLGIRSPSVISRSQNL